VLDFLRDPIWQFIGCLVGLLALGIGTWASLRGRAKKLVYEVIAQTPLLNFDLDSANQRLILLFNEKPIHNAEIVLTKIINAGSAPIRPDDYERPLRVTTGKSSKILDAKVVRTHPESLVVPISTVEDASLTFDSILLNPGDYFVVQAIVVPGAAISVDGRIAGVKEIKSEAHKRRSRRVMVTVFIWVVAIAVTYLIGSGFTDFQTTFLVIAMGFSTFFGGFVLPRLIDWVRDNT
jgi:hypothetical protein